MAAMSVSLWKFQLRPAACVHLQVQEQLWEILVRLHAHVFVYGVVGCLSATCIKYNCILGCSVLDFCCALCALIMC